MASTTFREIEIAEGIDSSLGDSPLEIWYARVRNVPLSALGVEDVCKSLRQDIYPEYVVPIAVELLAKDPQAGEMYDGELARAFRGIPEPFWRKHPQLAAKVVDVMKNAISQLDDDAKSDVTMTAAAIEAAINTGTK